MSENWGCLGPLDLPRWCVRTYTSRRQRQNVTASTHGPAMELVQNVFPPPARTGRPPRNRRETQRHLLDPRGPDSPRRDLPEQYYPWSTVWDLFDKWNADGTLDAILSRLRAAGIDAGLIDHELWCIDGTVVCCPTCCRGREGAFRGTSRSRLGPFSRGFHNQDPCAVRQSWPPSGSSI